MGSRSRRVIHKRIFRVVRPFTSSDVTLEAPLLLSRLSSDCIAHLIFFLNASDIELLYRTGNAELWRIIRNSSRELHYIPHKLDSLQARRVLVVPTLSHASSGFKRLERLVLHNHSYNYKNNPEVIASLPSTLREISLEFSDDMDICFFQHDYAQLFPHLHTLRLWAHKVQFEQNTEPNNDSWTSKFPKMLTTLWLYGVLQDPHQFALYLCGLTKKPTGQAGTFPLPYLLDLCLQHRPENATPFPLPSRLPPSLKSLRLVTHRSLRPIMVTYEDKNSVNEVPAAVEPIVNESASSSSSSIPTIKIPKLSVLMVDVVPATWTMSRGDEFESMNVLITPTWNIPDLPLSLTSLELFQRGMDYTQVCSLPSTLRTLKFNDYTTNDRIWSKSIFPHLETLHFFPSPMLSVEKCLSCLPDTLTELSWTETPLIIEESQVAALPRQLRIASLLISCLTDDISRALPRTLEVLYLTEDPIDLPGSDNEDFSTFFDLLPPSLRELYILPWRNISSQSLAYLPRTLRAFKLETDLELPPTPKRLQGISGSVSALYQRTVNGVDIKVGARNEDAINDALALLPEGCLVDVNFNRDKARVDPVPLLSKVSHHALTVEITNVH